ncbi:MAG: ParA family protein [Bacteroidaceae bacterium]|nr:ParA family protein [Bacteroidaceae bacterium]
MAKIIVFSNRKGGTGKSTLCIQFANFLASQGNNVAVLDVDPQQSVVDLRNREIETNPDAKLPWPVLFVGDKALQFMEQAQQMGDGYILVDCPGTITESIMPVFHAADAVVIPFRYDDLIVDSTITFVKVLKKAGVRSKLMFLPNCIDVRVKIPSEEQIRNIFKEVGTVLPRIRQGVSIQRCSTLRPIDQYQKAAIEYSVNELVREID